MTCGSTKRSKYDRINIEDRSIQSKLKTITCYVNNTLKQMPWKCDNALFCTVVEL
jgi:hypothetical protein